MSATSGAFVRCIADAAAKLQWQIMTAESCTGGMLAAALTGLPGSSGWYAGGIIAYQNDLKMRFLQVPSATLQAHGAVSEQTADAMCEGLANFGADAAASITGIAGPSGGTAEKPVGTVCFATLSPGSRQQRTRHFQGNRQQVREAATLFALGLLAAALEKAVAQQQ